MELDATMVALLTALFTAFLALFAFYEQRTAKRNLSLTAFLESLDQLGTKEAREARSYVINNFHDYSKNEFQPELQNGSTGNMIRKLRIAENPSEMRDVNKILEKDVLIRNVMEKDEKIFWYVAVGFDRVGFMLFELDSPKDIREKYLKWMGETICNVWNRLAPYLDDHRVERPNFVPHFQSLAMEAYRYIMNKWKQTKRKRRNLSL